MIFGQLTECNMRNIFLKDYTQNLVEKLVPDFFMNNEIEHISESLVQKFIQFLFIVWQVCYLLKYIETKPQTTYFHLTSSFFKNMKRSGTSHPASYSA